MLTMHVVVDEACRDHGAVVRQLKAVLDREFGIQHSTIEVEADRCEDH